MAPIIEHNVVVLYPWEVFTAIQNGQPCIGARLYTYAANTTTPKAAYHDPYYLNPQTNPIVMNDQGQAVVWLDGFYHLVLKDADDVTLWTIDQYEFPSSTPAITPGLLSGMTETTPITPSAGASLISVPNGVPTGYRCEGCLIRIDISFGTSNGLSGIMIGDPVRADRWGITALTAGTYTGQIDFKDASRPIAATPYVVLLSAMGGAFDAAGSCTVRTFWSAITGWS